MFSGVRTQVSGSSLLCSHVMSAYSSRQCSPRLARGPDSPTELAHQLFVFDEFCISAYFTQDGRHFSDLSGSGEIVEMLYKSRGGVTSFSSFVSNALICLCYSLSSFSSLYGILFYHVLVGTVYMQLPISVLTSPRWYR